MTIRTPEKRVVIYDAVRHLSSFACPTCGCKESDSDIDFSTREALVVWRCGYSIRLLRGLTQWHLDAYEFSACAATLAADLTP